MRYVIVGGGSAAVSAIESLRRFDAEGSLTLLSRENEFPYGRPLISYLLEGKTDEARMRLRPLDFFERHHVDARLGLAAARIDPEERMVEAEDGSRFPYDRLLVATGSRPFVPDIPGLSAIPYHTFMTLDDARALREAVSPNSRVLILGAGLIGMKCLEGVRGLCGEATVVDLANRVLPSILDEEAAETVRRHVEKQGVRFVLGESVTRFSPGLATLSGGETIPFDVLVVAVGVRPETRLLCDAGLDAERGVSVDEKGETALPGVFAAGDCAKCRDLSTGETRVLALLPGATMQGETCGAAMAGGSAPERVYVPMNAMGLFGLHMMTAGVLAGENHIVREAGGYKRLTTQNDRLTGFILLGSSVERAGIYTALLRERTPLDSIDFQLMLKKPQLMAFSQKDRQMRMGGSRL